MLPRDRSATGSARPPRELRANAHRTGMTPGDPCETEMENAGADRKAAPAFFLFKWRRIGDSNP